jgi:uncharacterized protein
MQAWISKRLPSRDALLGNRWIAPFAHQLTHPSLWHLNRRSLARGVALGLFVGLLVPLGQTPVAALLSLRARANVLVAAIATLVTNPLTFPAIYYAAYRVGTALLGSNVSEILGGALHVASSTGAGAWLLDTTAPIVLGLLLFAGIAAAVGFFGVHLCWRYWIARRWHLRGQLRRRIEPDDLRSRSATSAKPPPGSRVSPAGLTGGK